MSMIFKPWIKKLLLEQWPFWISGLLIGGAEVLYYWRYHTFITFTTSLGQMFAGIEQSFFPGSFLSKAFEPDINWVLLGLFLGGFIVALAEREFRTWVKYDRRSLIVAFFGAALFSFGTRLAGGCTTHHVLGGLAAMNIASIVVSILMFVSGLIAIYFYAYLGLAHYFKPQESRWYAMQSREFGIVNDALILDEKYKPNKDPWRITSLIFLILFLIIIGYGVFTKDWAHGFPSISIIEISFLLFIGVTMGVGVGKTGFGTGCAVLTPEMFRTMLTKENRLINLRINYLTRNFFLGMFPLVAILLAVLLLNVAILIGWIIYGIPLPATTQPFDFFSVGHVVGAIILSFGSVFMLGCEIRNYTRLGMGYLTSLVAFPGFIVGYLPYVLFKEKIDAWAFGSPFLSISSLPDLVSGKWLKIGLSLSFTFFILLLLIISFKTGIKKVGLSWHESSSQGIDRIMLKKILRGHIIPELNLDSQIGMDEEKKKP